MKTFEREYVVTGTLDFLKVETKGPLVDKLNAIGEYHFIKESLEFRRDAYEALKAFHSEKYGYDFDSLEGLAGFVDYGFIFNASDSLITRMSENLEFQGEMRIKLSCNNRIISFEVEDNGIGIESHIEPILFTRQITTKRNTTIAYTGGGGVHLFASREIIQRLEGDIYFRNKGQNQGAIFGYKFPLGALQ